MASKKQITANRSNARRSTGPKSATGKASSRKNARKHGLTAKEIVLEGEDAEAFTGFRDGLMTDLEPFGTIECELVDRLATLLWRLRRVPIVEKQLMNDLVEPSAKTDLSLLSYEELNQLRKLLIKAQGPNEEYESSAGFDDTSSKSKPKRPSATETLNVISRYETGLMHAVTRTLSLLHGLQSARLAKEEARRTIEGP